MVRLSKTAVLRQWSTRVDSLRLKPAIRGTRMRANLTWISKLERVASSSPAKSSFCSMETQVNGRPSGIFHSITLPEWSRSSSFRITSSEDSSSTGVLTRRSTSGCFNRWIETSLGFERRTDPETDDDDRVRIYHSTLRIPATASKCRSRLRRGSECWRHNAAIQTSLEGIGVPALFSSARTVL